MQIKDVCQKTNLTKKAIEYYIEQNLIQPLLLENGYRDFSEQDVAILSKIAIYRKLGLSIAEITLILEDENKLNEIICKHTIKIENEQKSLELLQRLSTGESLENIEKELPIQKSKHTILEKLLELFPGYYGRFIAMNFSIYLQDEIETKEQEDALYTIIQWLDQSKPLIFSESLKQFLDKTTSMIDVNSMKNAIETKTKNIEHFDTFIKENKTIIQDYLTYKKSDAYKKSEVYELQIALQKFCENSGYYDVFIPNMKRLSPSYNSYYSKLLEADKVFNKEFKK